jgi:hypothetical protein
MTDHRVDFQPLTDPLLRVPRLDLAVEVPLLGLTTRFETNSLYLHDLIGETFAIWRRAAAPTPGAPALRVRLIVHEGSEGTASHAPIRHICPDPERILMHSPGSVAIVDPGRQEAVAYVTTALAADRAHFRRQFLEALALALVTHFDRHPIHAAAIGRERVLLLAGPSGSGKSTLAYLAHVSGLGVLSEEIVWVEQQPGFRLWGMPRRVHLLPESVSYFPELRGQASTVDAEGKIPVNLAEPNGSTRVSADQATVCLLERGAGPPALDRLPPDAIADALRQSPDAGFDRFPERHESAIAALAKDGGWRLTLSNDPREALPLLQELVRSEK